MASTQRAEATRKPYSSRDGELPVRQHVPVAEGRDLDIFEDLGYPRKILPAEDQVTDYLQGVLETAGRCATPQGQGVPEQGPRRATSKPIQRLVSFTTALLSMGR